MESCHYRVILYVQCTLLITDVLVNSFSDVATRLITQIILFVIQGVCLVSNIIVMFLVFFSTYAFQAGLVSVLLRRFSVAILTGFIYLSLTIAFSTWTLKLKWASQLKYSWSTGLLVLYILQRSCSVLYYYFYKATALQLSNKCYYEDGTWLRKQLPYGQADT